MLTKILKFHNSIHSVFNCHFFGVDGFIHSFIHSFNDGFLLIHFLHSKYSGLSRNVAKTSRSKTSFFLIFKLSYSKLGSRVRLFHNFGPANVKHLFPYFDRALGRRILAFHRLSAKRCRIVISIPSKNSATL